MIIEQNNRELYQTDFDLRNEINFNFINKTKKFNKRNGQCNKTQNIKQKRVLTKQYYLFKKPRKCENL